MKLPAQLLPLALPLLAGAAPPEGPALIPLPAQMAIGAGTFRIAAGAAIVAPTGDPSAARMASYAADLVAKLGGPTLRVGASDGAIRLVRTPAGSLPAEGYRLVVTAAGIRLEASDDAGLRHATMTLAQLLTPGTQTPAGVAVPLVDIRDAPRFTWRGVMLDTARHIVEVAEIRKVIDMMAQHKLNRLQLHLADDQGWRIEIKRFPELTRIGAWRAGPVTNGPDDAKRYGGFYTQDELRSLVSYAAERGVTIVPEIDMPGHAQAAVASYPEVGVFKDRPGVSPDWGINPYLFGTDQQSWSFIEGVLDEVLAIFPSTYIHVGGDEAIKDQWRASPAVQAQMRTLGIKDEDGLQSWFMERLARYLGARGRRLIGWDEILEGGLPASASVMSWRGEEGAIAAANAGHDVVLSPGPVLYFDNLQSTRGDEPHGRLRIQSLADVYAYDPLPAKIAPERTAHVLGAQANLWAEYVKSSREVDHALFPRLDALAEISWSPKNARDWPGFLRRLEPQMARYGRQSVGSADSAFAVDIVPEQNAGDALRSGGTVVRLSNQAVHGTIRYTLDGSEPDSRSRSYARPIWLRMGQSVRAATFGAQGRPLSVARRFDMTPATLLTRDSAALGICSAAGIRLRVALQADTSADAPAYSLNIFDTCWTYAKAPLAWAKGIEVTLGRLARHYALREPQRRAVVWRYNPTRYGTVIVRLGTCDGPVVASMAIPDPQHSPPRLVLSAPLTGLAPQSDADLCLMTIPPEGGPIYGIEQVRMEAR